MPLSALSSGPRSGPGSAGIGCPALDVGRPPEPRRVGHAVCRLDDGVEALVCSAAGKRALGFEPPHCLSRALVDWEDEAHRFGKALRPRQLVGALAA